MESSIKPQKPLTKKQQRLAYFEKLLCFQHALYDPITKKKLFIVNSGLCVKKDCAPEKTLHKAKVLIPESSRYQLTNDVSLAEQMAESVVCFAHFSTKDQLKYLVDGFFPPDTKMCQYKMESGTKLSKPQIHTFALKNDVSWVRLISTIYAKT